MVDFQYVLVEPEWKLESNRDPWVPSKRSLAPLFFQKILLWSKWLLPSITCLSTRSSIIGQTPMCLKNYIHHQRAVFRFSQRNSKCSQAPCFLRGGPERQRWVTRFLFSQASSTFSLRTSWIARSPMTEYFNLMFSLSQCSIWKIKDLFLIFYIEINKNTTHTK
jgi:hypothetical protein